MPASYVSNGLLDFTMDFGWRGYPEDLLLYCIDEGGIGAITLTFVAWLVKNRQWRKASGAKSWLACFP